VHTQIEQLAERAREPIRKAARMEPDYSLESLAAVDHYLRQLPAAAPEELLAIAAQIGCYFGEVARRALGGRWDTTDEDPKRWRLTFDAAPLWIFPIGMAAEAVYEGDVSEYDGSLHVVAVLEPLLARALAAMGEVDEEYYYSLTGRLETIQHVLDVLAAARAAAKNGRSRAKPARPRRS